MKTQQLEIARNEPQAVATRPPMPVSSLSILQAAIEGGINKENVDVVERLVALRRDEMREESKAAFARAFFQLRKEIMSMEIYADKTVKTLKGDVVCTYCSEQELSEKLEPLLLRHGFAMMFGQRHEEGRAVAMITLIHEAGHQELREYSVRSGATNRVKDDTAADAGATTTAWRHLVIKLFGLKSRIKDTDDPRNLGEHITSEQAFELSARVNSTGSDERAFLRYAGVKIADNEIPVDAHYQQIMSSRYSDLDASLKRKEKTR